MTLHEDEVEIDEPLVRRLVDRSFPELAGLPLRAMPVTGSTNVLFRLGADLVVRLPRQPAGSSSLRLETRWLAHLADRLPVATPTVVAVGEPGPGYPLPWTVTTWLDGDRPEVPVRPAGADWLARDLALLVRTLGELEVPLAARSDAALAGYRGRPLAELDASMREYLADCRTQPGLDLDLDACRRVWDAALELPGAAEPAPPRWLHGDLFAENLLVRDGRLAAVLDFGGLAVGDPTVDLAGAWELFEPPARDTFRAVLGVDEVTWLRGRAWALAIAVMTFPYYWRTMPERCAARLVTARAVLADATRVAW